MEGLQREREDLRAELSRRGERRSRGRSRSLPNPSPDLFTGELQRGSVVNGGTFVECHGNIDRQCGVVSQVKPPVHGLRAQQVGEASHPGPRTQIPNRTYVTLGQPIERVEFPTVQDSSTMKCCVGHRLSQAPGDGVGDCELCHGLRTAIRSRTGPEQSSFRDVVPRDRGRFARDRSRESDGISKQLAEGCVQQKSHCTLWMRWRGIWTVVKRHFPGGWCCTQSHPEEPHHRFRTGHLTCRCVATGSQLWQTQRPRKQPKCPHVSVVGCS